MAYFRRLILVFIYHFSSVGRPPIALRTKIVIHNIPTTVGISRVSNTYSPSESLEFGDTHGRVSQCYNASSSWASLMKSPWLTTYHRCCHYLLLRDWISAVNTTMFWVLGMPPVNHQKWKYSWRPPTQLYWDKVPQYTCFKGLWPS